MDENREQRCKEGEPEQRPKERDDVGMELAPARAQHRGQQRGVPARKLVA